MAKLEIVTAKLEELSLVPRRSKSLRSQNPPLATPSSYSCSFMNDVNDDFLIEILLRLSDARLAVQFGLVSKRWSSLIFSHEFRKRFNQNHRHHLSRYLEPSYSLPYTLLFTFHNPEIHDITFLSHALSSNAMPGIHYYTDSAGYLDFWPENDHGRTIEISSGDLVLSSVDGHPIKYCVSNPLTKQWKTLPQDMPPLLSRGVSGLWLDPNHYGSNRRLGNYKVVIIDTDIINYFLVVGDDYRFRVLMFCSETGRWSERIFRAPRASALSARARSEPVQSKGVLYFPLTKSGLELKGFMALDPVGSSDCRVLDVPDGFEDGWRAELFLRVGFGVVRGRLWLWQFLKNNRSNFDLKVWELCDDETTWVLVHDVTVKRGKTKGISVVAFDPNDGDVVFMVLNRSICKYNIRENKNEKVGLIPKTKRTSRERDYVLWNFMTVHTVVHSSWRVLPK